MPYLADFELARGEDGVVTIVMTPPVPITNWSIRFDLSKRFNGTAFVSKYAGSGIANGASGIYVTDYGAGVFNVILNAADTSGLDLSNYAFTAARTDSGYRTVLSEGYLVLTPGQG